MAEYSKHSINRLSGSLANYKVPGDYADPVEKYLLYGWPPGGFFSCLLANDAMGAIERSHPLNDMMGLKNLVIWINHHLVKDIHYGSYQALEKWYSLSLEDKRKSLEEQLLVYDKQTEILMMLKD